MPGRGAEERKGEIAPCLSLAPVFTPRSKWLEAFAGPAAPASPRSAFQPAASPPAPRQQKWLSPSLHLPGWDHCIQQLELCCFRQHSCHQSCFIRVGSETFPKPFEGLAALRHDPFSSSGYFAFGGFFNGFHCLDPTEGLYWGVKSEAMYRTSASHGIKKRNKAIKHK